MTSLDNGNLTTPLESESKIEDVKQEVDDTVSNDSLKSNSSTELLSCQKCQKEYLDYNEFYEHVKGHVQLPNVVLQRVDDPVIQRKSKCGPLKFTVRTTNNNFSIVKSSEINDKTVNESNLPRIPKLRILLPEQLSEQVTQEEKKSDTVSKKLNNSENNSHNGVLNQSRDTMVELHTLPNDSQSPSFPTQSPAQPDTASNDDHNSFWSSEQSSEDPLSMPQSGEKEAETHNSLLQNFLNDSVGVVAAKESVLNSNETEYISLERLAEKSSPLCPVCRERCLDQQALAVHQKAMGHYVSNHSSHSSNLLSNNNSLVPYGQPPLGGLSSSPLDSLTNLPMQQLAQQVNRLQQGGVHQQNVLINIQQFGQPMNQPMGPPPQYRPPNLSHYPGPSQHYPGQQQPAHMYGGFHPPPMNHPMYYPPTSGMYPPMSHSSPSQQMPHPYVPTAPHHPPQRMMPPRGPPPPQQQSMAPPPPPSTSQMRPRARMPMHRASAPRMMGPRSASINTTSGGGLMRPNVPQQVRPRRPPPSTIVPETIKRQKLDVFLPDTNDNDECSVISVQKCNDGLPIIKNVQGATSSPTESDPIVHLTDSITLSVRNPKDIPVVQQKKNDAKAVANILATRGITVTPAAKSAKESNNPEPKRVSPKPSSPPVAINLNNAVSIIPTARGNNSNTQQKEVPSNRPPRPPTVDLTDDEPGQAQSKSLTAATVSKRTLPHHCDLCPAQYPTLQSLMQHRKTYHKTVGQNELGVPVIDLKQTPVLNKLASIGIHSYIPLPQLGNGSGSFALPIVSVNAAKNPNICNLAALGSGAVLPLGPLRHISNPKQ